MQYLLNQKINSLLKISLIVFCLSSISCGSSLKVAETKPVAVETERLSVLNTILTNKVLRVGTTGDFVPFSYQTNLNSDIYKGVDIELAKDLATSLNAELQLISTTWKTLIDDLQANKFDIAMSGITITLARQQKVLFSIPVLSSGKAAITRDENIGKYQTLEAINQPKVKVIVNPGGTNEIFAKTNFPNATIIENKDNLSIFEKIIDGTADVMVTDAIETLVQEQIHPELEAVNPTKPFNFFEMGYLLTVDHTFKAYIDQWLNLRLKDGTYQKIFDAELLKIKNLAIKENKKK